MTPSTIPATIRMEVIFAILETSKLVKELGDNIRDFQKCGEKQVITKAMRHASQSLQTAVHEHLRVTFTTKVVVPVKPQFLAITCNPPVCTNISEASNSLHKLMFRHHRREITSKVFTAATSCPPKNCKATKSPKWKQEKHRRQGCSASHRHHRRIQIRFARYHLLFTQRNCQET